MQHKSTTPECRSPFERFSLTPSLNFSVTMLKQVVFLWAALLAAVAHGTVLSTSSRWIVDSSGKRFKLRCVNWAGAAETKIPEGLAAQPVDTITSMISSGGFNCVRLTYSIDMALNPNQKVSQAFSSAASSTGQSSLNSLYNTAKSKNSFLASGTTRGAFEAVINSLAKKNILVILDNHDSHASWCCSTTDGNGWWKQASGYVASNSQYFDANDWIAGLSAMASWSKGFSNVVGLSLRNELRAVENQDQNSHADWYNYMSKGVSAIHQGNPNALVMAGGVNYATDLSFIYNKQLDKAGLGVSNKLVWEFHSYQWSNADTDDCSKYTTDLGNSVGYLLTPGKAYTGPLWLSEFGFAQLDTSSAESAYWSCLRSYLENDDGDWAYWALQGSYYIRQGAVDADESYGLLKHDWSGWRNSGWKSQFGTIFSVTQGP